CAQTIAFPPTF
nr:immunoglobulin light chain junction region [Macaca mulatta]